MAETVVKASSALRRCLSDAEAAAREGNGPRSRDLLQLALDLMDPTTAPMVLLTAHAVRDTLRTRGSSLNMSVPRAVESELPLQEEQSRRVDDNGSLGFPLPNFPTSPPGVLRNVPIANLYAEIAVEPLNLRPVDNLAVGRTRTPLAQSRPARRRSATLHWVVLVGFVGGAGWLGAEHLVGDPVDRIYEEATAALDRGSGAVALAALLEMSAGQRREGGALLLGGRAYLLEGDTAEAVRVLAEAAAAPLGSGMVAWEAAQVLATLQGFEAAAADAYLMAFTAGLPVGMWEEVARAHERVGREAQAERIREMVEDGG